MYNESMKLPYPKIHLPIIILILYHISGATSTLANNDTDSPTINVNPHFQEITVTENTTASVNFTNHTHHPIQIEFKALSITTFDILGRIVFDQSIKDIKTIIPPDHLGLYPRNALLSPGETTEVSVSLDPNELDPGGNYIMILGVQKSDLTEDESVNQKVEHGLASVILINQPSGAITQFKISDQSWPRLPVVFKPPTSIQLTLSNTGNVHITPRGLIETQDIFGRTTHRGYINQSSLYIFPDNSRLFKIDNQRLRLALPLTPLTITTTTYDHDRQTFDQKTSSVLYVSPLILLLPLIVLLLKRIRFKPSHE